jgi:hypothetical protein
LLARMAPRHAEEAPHKLVLVFDLLELEWRVCLAWIILIHELASHLRVPFHVAEDSLHVSPPARCSDKLIAYTVRAPVAVGDNTAMQPQYTLYAGASHRKFQQTVVRRELMWQAA